MNKQYYRAMTIAGSDSGGGAGIQADLKTFSALGCYGSSVITALTAQNTQGVVSVHDVKGSFIKQQFLAVMDDIGTDVIKLGMLHRSGVIEVITQCLRDYPSLPIVIDPVMVATSGDVLLEPEALALLIDELLPLATLITPNVLEAELILKCEIPDHDTAQKAAENLAHQFRCNVLIKGGHLSGRKITDIFYDIDDDKFHFDHRERINTVNTHGTGCTLSSAYAAHLALGHSAVEAFKLSSEYIHQAVSYGRLYKIGHGHGPVHHFHRYW